MSQIIYKLLFIFCMILCWGPAGFAAKPELRLPLKTMFSHKVHQPIFNKGNISCTECHNFSIKSPGFDPLSTNVGAGHILPSRKVCHECHLGKVEVPIVNQCSLCHLNSEKLAPPNHRLAWKNRHGAMAQMAPESCNGCHKENQNSCTNCHLQKNTLKPSVHRPNFRLTHSLEARANPAKCAICHSTISTCTQCHRGGFK